MDGDVAVNLEPIIAHWTHCYHVTAVMNLQSIRRFGILLPAAALFGLADRGDLLRRRRTDDVRLELEGQKVLVRNQIALDPDSINIGFTETIEDHLACLNAHVFFWPGTASGPTHDGMRMFRQRAGVKSALGRCLAAGLREVSSG